MSDNSKTQKDLNINLKNCWPWCWRGLRRCGESGWTPAGLGTSPAPPGSPGPAACSGCCCSSCSLLHRKKIRRSQSLLVNRRVDRVLGFFFCPNWDPPPLTRRRVCLSLWCRGDTLACGRGGGEGVPIRTRGHMLWNCIGTVCMYFVLWTLYQLVAFTRRSETKIRFHSREI
jgi:hypothetical protein